MPKLLSRSKHEEFESNSALQIRDEKERRVENAENLEHCRNASYAYCSSCLPLFMSLAATVHLFFTLSCFCYNFLFLPILSLLIPYDLGFFVIFPCSEHI